MFCAQCGTINAETARVCGRCGASLEMQADFPLALNPQNQSPTGRDLQRPTSQALADSSLFAPIAHSPFSNEPLPRLSDAQPSWLQPAGDSLVFVPGTRPAFPPTAAGSSPAQPAQASSTGPLFNSARRPAFRDLADYPTETQVPALSTPPLLAAYPGTPVPMPTPPGVQHTPYELTPPQMAVYSGPIRLPTTVEPRGQESTAHTTQTSANAHAWIRPLPLWASLAGLAVGALGLLALVLLNADWATGATVAGTAALILAGLLLVVAGVRVALGLLASTNPHRRAQAISTVLLVLVLFLIGGAGLTQQARLHPVQARVLENQHNWQAAIAEYQAAGETAPTSETLARVYNAWGEDLSSHQQYADAVTKFSIVLGQYTRATEQANQARHNLVATYLAWADFASLHQDYAGATAHYDALLSLNTCDSACQSLAGLKDGAAYAQLAEQQFKAQQFAPAVAAFKALTARFASTLTGEQVPQIHADYAQALWGLGQQQLHTTCADAVTTYQQLGKQFADTPQGKQAETALREPVRVSGQFTQSIPGAPYHPTAFLIQGLSVGIQQYQFPPLLRKAPTAPIASNGSFAFPAVPPGTYELVWSSDSTRHFYYASNGHLVLYTALIGPLCPYTFGDINQTIPTRK